MSTTTSPATTLTMPSDRDGHIQSGMEPGMRETMDRLAELLATLT